MAAVNPQPSKPRKPAGLNTKPYPPVKPSRIRNNTLNNPRKIVWKDSVSYSDGSFSIREIIDSIPEEELDGAQFHVHAEAELERDYGGNYATVDEISCYVQIYPQKTDEEYAEEIIAYEEATRRYKADMKRWKKYETEMKAYTDWQKKENRRKQFERLKKEFADDET